MPHSNISQQTRQRAKIQRSQSTLAETIMWRLLREFRPRGARFCRQALIGPYIADFAWLSRKIVIEVDGASHKEEAGIARQAAGRLAACTGL